jgi:hypothetical protein
MAIHSTNDLVKAALAYPPRSGNAHPLYLRRVDALLRLTQPSGPQTREHDLTSVTVAAPSTMDADVWSTALDGARDRCRRRSRPQSGGRCIFHHRDMLGFHVMLDARNGTMDGVTPALGGYHTST